METENNRQISVWAEPAVLMLEKLEFNNQHHFLRVLQVICAIIVIGTDGYGMATVTICAITRLRADLIF